MKRKQGSANSSGNGDIVAILSGATNKFFVTAGVILIAILVVGTVYVIRGLPESIDARWDEVPMRILQVFKIVGYFAFTAGAIIGAALLASYQRLRVQAASLSLEITRRELAMGQDILKHREDLAEQIVRSLLRELPHFAKQGAPADTPNSRGLPALRFPTLFGERYSHFHDEKAMLADRCFQMLLVRIQHLVHDEGRSVVILIDSGTTLLPLFRLFGRWGGRLRGVDDETTRSVRLVTNSVAGIEALSLYGRLGDDPYSEVALKAELLGGTPLAVYSAIVGETAKERIHDLPRICREEDDSDGQSEPFVIGLTTGNYIFLKGGLIKPIARGTGHGDIKQAIYDVADELFVVGPLGKFIVEREHVNLAAFNRALGYTDQHVDPRMRSYSALEFGPTQSKTVHAITTSRPDGAPFVFVGHSLAVATDLRAAAQGVHVVGTNDEFDRYKEGLRCPALTGVGHVMFQYDSLPDDTYEQLKQELPHGNVMRGEIRKRFFDVAR